MEPVKIGAVMRAGGIGRVLASRAKGVFEGDLVSLLVFRAVKFTPALEGFKKGGRYNVIMVLMVGVRNARMAGVLGRTRQQGRSERVSRFVLTHLDHTSEKIVASG